jgi:hypothetical protein
MSRFSTAMVLSVIGLLAALSADAVRAQSIAPVKQGRLTEGSVRIKGSPTNVAVLGAASVKVSKTAFVDGQNVCGAIRITNVSGQPAIVSGMADSLEVHFPLNVPPPALPAGSTITWFKVADVPIPLPGPIAPGATATIDYCFSLCLATDAPGANAMRNVVAVTLANHGGRVNTVTTRSISFAPPVLDCQACCLPDGSCTDTQPSNCAAASGLSAGAGTDCATTECRQACCLGNGSCDDETVRACADHGGAPLGLGTTCATANTTCRGACCVDALGGCTDDTSVDACAAAGGNYLGNDTTCAAAATTTCPTGACCFQGTCRDASNEGVSLSRSRCDGVGGGYLGDGTTCATANTTCRGACCVDALGGCTDDTSVDACAAAGGNYLGNDTTCAAAATTTCPTGACCFQGTCRDASNEGVSLSRSRCDGVGGGYLGDGTTCNPTSCTEACCFGGSCEELLPGVCEGQGGDPQGPGTDCGILGISPCSFIEP